MILTSADNPDALRMGGKAAALAELSHANLPIPRWFVITPDTRPDDGAMTDEIRSRLLHAFDGTFQPDTLVAVRSSAVDEDGGDHSFAGQLESYLAVPRDQLADRVAAVWASGFTERVLAYRAENKLTGPAGAPAVLVQELIDADVAGVAFAADPVSGSRSTVVISAVFGLGTALVGGDADADTFRLRQNGSPIDQQIAHKTERHRPDSSGSLGYRVEPVPPSDADRATLDLAMQQQIVALVLQVSRLRARPQDIEFAVRDGKLYLLQSRPITSLARLPDADGARAIWDNSNIAESYNGITTPLTFTFARHAYEGVYREFCRMMKVPERVIADNDTMFGQMLGLVRGRVYYNLLNWYRLLAMLPGFSVNQRFMEQMMGVREGLPPEIAASVQQRTWSQRQGDRLRLARSAGGLIWNHFVLAGKIQQFYKRLNIALAPPTPPLEQMRLDALAAEYRRLESQLLTKWDAPLINDFLAMIFFGVLGKMCAKAFGESGETLQNDLIADEGGIVSMEPAQRINAMAQLARADAALVDSLCDDPPERAIASIQRRPALQEQYRAYLEKFGDRCLEELKLESTTLTDDPTPLLRSIGHAARRANDAGGASKGYHPRAAAEERLRKSPANRGLRGLIFRWVIRNARARVRDRENLRFERTRLFGRMRRIFLEIGRRLTAETLLDDPRDIFFLTLEEIIGFVEGTAVSTDLRGLVALRRAEFDRYRTDPAPADRFETWGAVHVGNQFQASGSSSTDSIDNTTDLRGTGCCPGIVRGRARLIRDPRGAMLAPGEILVAERTDPGWILLFPAASGVIVERGSLLSHSAIVAREMGIPAIVSVPHLMNTLTDGEWIEMDGSRGTIRRLSSDEVPA